jgi:hypothetical protein
VRSRAACSTPSGSPVRRAPKRQKTRREDLVATRRDLDGALRGGAHLRARPVCATPPGGQRALGCGGRTHRRRVPPPLPPPPACLPGPREDKCRCYTPQANRHGVSSLALSPFPGAAPGAAPSRPAALLGLHGAAGRAAGARQRGKCFSGPGSAHSTWCGAPQAARRSCKCWVGRSISSKAGPSAGSACVPQGLARRAPRRAAAAAPRACCCGAARPRGRAARRARGGIFGRFAAPRRGGRGPGPRAAPIRPRGGAARRGWRRGRHGGPGRRAVRENRPPPRRPGRRHRRAGGSEENLRAAMRGAAAGAAAGARARAPRRAAALRRAAPPEGEAQRGQGAQRAAGRAGQGGRALMRARGEDQQGRERGAAGPGAQGWPSVRQARQGGRGGGEGVSRPRPRRRILSLSPMCRPIRAGNSERALHPPPAPGARGVARARTAAPPPRAAAGAARAAGGGGARAAGGARGAARPPARGRPRAPARAAARRLKTLFSGGSRGGGKYRHWTGGGGGGEGRSTHADARADHHTGGPPGRPAVGKVTGRAAGGSGHPRCRGERGAQGAGGCGGAGRGGGGVGGRRCGRAAEPATGVGVWGRRRRRPWQSGRGRAGGGSGRAMERGGGGCAGVWGGGRGGYSGGAGGRVRRAAAAPGPRAFLGLSNSWEVLHCAAGSTGRGSRWARDAEGATKGRGARSKGVAPPAGARQDRLNTAGQKGSPPGLAKTSSAAPTTRPQPGAGGP